jgi:predicted nucleotidyltransferase
MATIPQPILADSRKSSDWGITEERVRQAVQRIVEVSNPLQVIAFGSWARGEQRPDSDLDLAVILEDSPDAMARRPRYSMLEGIRMSIDLVVATQSRYEQFRDSINSIHGYIAREGIVLYDREAR